MKSKFKQLLKNDYFEIITESIIGAISGYFLPIIKGDIAFNLLSFKLALFGALSMGIRKAYILYFKNSEGKIYKKEKNE